MDEPVERAVEHRLCVAGLVVGGGPLRAGTGGARRSGFDCRSRCPGATPRLFASSASRFPPPARRGERGMRSAGSLLRRLGALVLTLDDGPGREVGDADRGVGLVHVLPAGPGRPVRVDPEVASSISTSMSSGRSGATTTWANAVPPVRGVERREAHEAVDAALGLHDPVRVLAADGDGGRLEACLLACARLQGPPSRTPGRPPSGRYMRSSISAQSWASVPPVPAWISRMASPPSYWPVEERFLLEQGELGLDGRCSATSPSSSGSSPYSSFASSNSALQALVALELASGARVPGRDACRRRPIAPEVGRAHRLLELRAAPARPSGSVAITDPGELGPDLLEALIEARAGHAPMVAGRSVPVVLRHQSCGGMQVTMTRVSRAFRAHWSRPSPRSSRSPSSSGRPCGFLSRGASSCPRTRSPCCSSNGRSPWMSRRGSSSPSPRRRPRAARLYANVHLPILFVRRRRPPSRAGPVSADPHGFRAVVRARGARHRLYPLAPPHWLTELGLGAPPSDAESSGRAAPSSTTRRPPRPASTSASLSSSPPRRSGSSRALGSHGRRLAYPALVFVVIVGTGNHYVLDCVVGTLTFVLAAFVASCTSARNGWALSLRCPGR